MPGLWEATLRIGEGSAKPIANVGLPPMEYLLAWRMALAKDLLRREEIGIAEVAERVGYGSASTFSTAFSRHVGLPPGRYAREKAA